jgi:hypothetical protein
VSVVSQNWTTTAPTLQVSTSLTPGQVVTTAAARSTPDWATGHGPALGGQDSVTGALPSTFTNVISTNTSLFALAGKGA